MTERVASISCDPLFLYNIILEICNMTVNLLQEQTRIDI